MQGRGLDQLIHAKLIENYEKYYRLAYSYTHNETDAMDIVQEGAYKAIYKSDSIKKEAYIESWIYRIMINESLQFLRKQKKETWIDLEKTEHTDSSKNAMSCKAAGTYENINSDENIDLQRALSQLPKEDRAIILLKYFEEFPIHEIAEILELNENTVKSRLYRAMRKMKESLEG